MDDELKLLRADYISLLTEHEYPADVLWKTLYQARKFEKIEVPFYLAGNHTDAELHLPGNALAFSKIASKYKWLVVHTGIHLGNFYEPDHVKNERRFLDYFLMDKKDNGMLDVPKVRILIRQGVDSYWRTEADYPPQDAQDISLFLTADQKLLSNAPEDPAVPMVYEGLTGSLTFHTTPMEDDLEILGSPYLEVEVETEAKDLDLFIYFRAIDSEGKHIITPGNHDEPSYSFARTFWRLSHRDEYPNFLKTRIPEVAEVPRSQVAQNKLYKVIVPCYPTSFVLEKGQSLQIQIGSADEQYMIPPMRHTGGDRTKERFAGKNTLFSNGRIVLPTVKRTGSIEF